MTAAKRPGATIRPATPGDVPMLCKLIMELAIYERAPDECHATPEKMHEQLFGDHPHAEAIVAEMGGDVVGYAIFFHNFSTWEAAPGLYLEDVYVRPTFRKKGIGKMLITALAAIAKERGCARYEWSCLDWNKPSRDFYESLGARCMTEWVIYRTEGDALARLAEEGRAHLDAMRKIDEPNVSDPEKTQLATTFSVKDLVIVHTDGGSSPNPGVGGWAAVLRAGSKVVELKGGEIATTNNRMEMTAAVKALEAVPANGQVQIHTDSQYLKNGITSWIKNWKRNGWKSRTGPVKNADLWRRLDMLCSQRRVEWLWLKGHAGHEDNERCDALCTEVIEKLTSRTTERDRREALARAKESGEIS